MGPAFAREPVRYPLSFTQERLWFIDKVEPGLSIYNVPEAFRLKGRLDAATLERSINAIVSRHEILRTTFAEADGAPVQLVAAGLVLSVPVHDLTHLAAGERDREAARRLNDDVNQPFDLEHGPLLRVNLFRLAEDDHLLLINLHHIVSEGGWSMALFLRELNALYAALGKDEPSPLPELEIQYGDYAAWQRDWLQGAVVEEMLGYWKQHLQGAPGLLELPTDRPRPAKQSYAGSRESRLLPASLKAALQQLSAREGATLFMTLLAAFSALLSRYCRQEDVLLGVPVAGRNSPETHNLIGFFVNTLALRTDLSGDPSFRELLQRVRQATSDALSHDELPFELLVEALKPDRTQAHAPVFQVMFAYQNAPSEALALPGIVSIPYDVEVRTSMFDLRLFAWERPDGVLFTLEYSTALFDAATIQSLLQRFQVLLEAAAANPDSHVSRLPLMTQQERCAVLEDWNRTARPFPAVCLHQLFENQAADHPGKAALIFGSHQLSYRDLNARANQLARYLIERGVTNGSLVGLYLERSFEMVIAIYGILKAGAAYVPYDPELPASRLAAMLDDSRPALVLTQSRLAPDLAGHSVQLLALDADAAALAGRPSSNPDVAIGDDDPIYAIYTSGSTGMPKAAVNTHRAVANRILWMQDQYQLTSADRVLQKTPYTFDVSVWEFFWPLVTSATLVIAEPGGHRDPAYLRDLIEKTHISTLHFVPSMLREFLNSDGVERCRSLRMVICSGEALPRELQDAFFERLPAALHNLYGPTEAAVDVTYWECRRDSTRASVPIGKPIANVKIHVLDPHLNPVPPGVPGELHIGGVALARGYLNRPELTASKFITDPFSPDPEARLYKTGDLARYLSDGNVEYLGRIDNQVKLRGFRIELGDIEAHILKYGAAGAAVMIREDKPGDKRLVAYVVPGDAPFDFDALRKFLRDRLPDYMVPSAFVSLHSLPQTASGKLDRRALPAPDLAPDAGQFVAPRTNYEVRLARIWEEVLQVSPIGIHDNYFELGGHSLLAVRLFASIRKVFNIDLPLATLYGAPTIESLAAVLADQGDSALWSPLVPIRRQGSKPPFYLVSGVGGGVLVFRDLAVHLGDDQPVYALQPKRPGENESHPTTIEEMAAQYIREIVAQQPEGPYYIGGYSLGGFIAYEMAQQLTRAGHEIAFLGIFDANAPLRIAKSNFSLPQRHTGSRLARLVQLIRTNSLGGVLKRRFEARRVWAGEKLARFSKRSLPPELLTLEGSQAFAGLNYVGRPYSGSMTLFRSASRPADEPWSYQLGWESIVGGGVEVHEVAGDHLTIYSTHIGILADKVNECLARAQSSQETLEPVSVQ